MASSLPHGQAAVRRIIALAVVILAVVLAGGAGLMTYMAASADQAQVAEERALMSRRLDDLQGWLQQDASALASDEQAYAHLGRPDPDLAWADEALGARIARSGGDAALLVLDATDRPTYAWRGAGRAEIREVQALRQDLTPLLADLRAREAVNLKLTHTLAHDRAREPVSGSGLVRSAGVIHLAAFATVAPPGTRSGPAPIVMTAWRLDQNLLRRLEDQLHISRVRLVPADPTAHGARYPLTDVNGFVVGDLVWTPKQPGREMLARGMPVFAVMLSILIVSALALAARISAILREMAARDTALDRTMEELVRARDQANAASVAKSQFLANMSHEIRTPLNGILGMAQVMSREDLSEGQRDRLNVITGSGHTLLAVLNDVLDISKIEAGRLEIDNHEFDLGEALKSACAPFTALAAQKDVQLNLDLDPLALGLWWGDSTRLRQILTNLVSNAVKFTAEGHVTVSAEPIPGGLRFAVRDSGIGIPSDRLGDLFQKFSQVDATTTRRFGGTGLGLAICKELTELMGGRMWAASEAGQGSTFAFQLPLEKRADQVVDDVADTASAPRTGAIRILAAEDNPTNQLILKSLLEPFGVDLTVVGDGREAVEAFSLGPFDLIVMDIQMPEMNVVEATAAIRAAEAAQDRAPTPILALSANVMSHQVREYLAAGMSGFVSKPIEAPKLLTAIDVALAEAEQQGVEDKGAARAA